MSRCFCNERNVKEGGNMNLRLLLSIFFVLMIMASPASALDQHGLSASQISQLWEQYKANFIQSDGRVIDRQQRAVSHSESQGYGLLLSMLNDDRVMFETIMRWTNNNLQARRDNLLPWAWGKRHTGQWEIIDYNNATDGDVLVAFALIRAAARWDVPAYRLQGVRIAEAVRGFLSEEFEGRSYLLPAYSGFQKDSELVLNPSYQIFAAYRLFAQADNKLFWDKIHRDSLFLLKAATFGNMKLPTDWVVLRKTETVPWEERAPLFGNEAIRTMLYLSWEENARFPEGLMKLLAFYQQKGYLPAHVDLKKNEVSPDEASAGFYAVIARAAGKTGRDGLSRQLWSKALARSAHERENYYSMSLFLLALHTI